MTCRMSLVRWYSIVPFQWRNVLKVILRILGFFIKKKGYLAMRFCRSSSSVCSSLSCRLFGLR